MPNHWERHPEQRGTPCRATRDAMPNYIVVQDGVLAIRSFISVNKRGHLRGQLLQEVEIDTKTC